MGLSNSSADVSNLSGPMPPSWVGEALRSGLVIPAHPLALNQHRRLDEVRQRGLTRYYHAAGAQGLAVGVHTTQFEIRSPQHGLLRPVLELAAETARQCDKASGRQTVLIAGICGDTRQAVAEAKLARQLGYHVGMISLGGMADASEDALVAHCATVAQEIPIFGFYMQRAVGGRDLPDSFWRRLGMISNLMGVKIAPFDRYRTLDVARAIAEIGRAEEVPLYTGNDDNIVLDLLTEYSINTGSAEARLRIVGGLLGHWACWTSRAVELLKTCKATWHTDTIPASLLTLAAQVTDCNAALFDAKNDFRGCIAGVHYALQRQGLLENTCCLDPAAQLSPGQQEEIDRVCRVYPHLIDDAFVREHLDSWLA